MHPLEGAETWQIDAEGEWQEMGKAMDKAILLEREPILFFADVPLYESELDDNGSSQLSTKAPSPHPRAGEKHGLL
jgi:hypothetical protein